MTPKMTKKMPILGPKMSSKMGQNRDRPPKAFSAGTLIFGSIFGSRFFAVLELFGCLLGAFLGLLRLFWEASGPKNLKKLNVF